MQLQTFMKGAIIALAIIIASCTISMMVIFIGGSAGGGDMQTLLVAQSAAIIPALLIVLADAIARARSSNRGTQGLWQSLPAWLILALLLPNLLVVIGELSLFIRQRLTGAAIHWFEHAPLICTLVCSAALFVLYVRAYPTAGNGHRNVGRW